MEGWHYALLVTAITVFPAVGLSLLCRTELERDGERRQPRWVRAKAAVLVAVGGALAVGSLPRDKPVDAGENLPNPELER